LRQQQVDIEEINYAKTALPESVIKDIVKKAGGVAAVLNTRHEIAKTKGWADKPPSAADFAKAAATEPNLLRRPILVDGDRVIVGFDQAAYKKL
jgi:arsenate reductase-like glutaredoxin family protein